jgi:hypothetical protein
VIESTIGDSIKKKSKSAGLSQKQNWANQTKQGWVNVGIKAHLIPAPKWSFNYYLKYTDPV